MNFKNVVFLTIATVSASGLTAGDYCYNSSDSCCLDNNISVYGDWLYWRTRKCDLDYALPFDGTNSIGKVYGVTPGWDSGFRIGASGDCGDWKLSADYSWFRTSSSSTVTDVTNGDLAGTHLIDNITTLSQGDFQYANGSWKLDYDHVNVLLANDCFTCGCLKTNLFTGFTYAHVNQRLRSLYSATPDITGTSNAYDDVTQKWNMDAYGLAFGFAPSYKFSDCLTVFGLFSYSAYAADFERKFIYDTSTDGGATITEVINLKDDCWRVSSLVNLAVGVKYNFSNPCGCGLDFALSLGYEFRQWLNTPGFLEYQNESGEINLDRYQSDFGFDGLFLRLEASF